MAVRAAEWRIGSAMFWIALGVLGLLVLFLVMRVAVGGEADEQSAEGSSSAPEAETKAAKADDKRADAAGAGADDNDKAEPAKDDTAARKSASASAPSGSARASASNGAPAADAAEEPTKLAPDADDTAELDVGLAEEVAPFPDEPTGPIALILVTGVGRTDVGRRRDHNEDAYLVEPGRSLFLIADGMGGHAAGEVASQLASDTIAKAFTENQFDGEPKQGHPKRGSELVRAIEMANSAIHLQARSNEAQRGMGTTIVASRFSPNKQRVYIAHVGDSRCYRLRNGRLEVLTTDHTLAAHGIKGPTSGRLTRAVGTEETVEVDLTVDAPLPGDHYMLCTDGLWKMVPDAMMKEIILSERDLDRACSRLIDLANDRGGKDNVTVILIRVEQPEALAGSDTIKTASASE